LAAVVLTAVYRPARAGRKVAYLTLASFVFLAIMLAAGLLMDSRHWGRGERGEGRGERERTVNWSLKIGHWSLAIGHSNLQWPMTNPQ